MINLRSTPTRTSPHLSKSKVSNVPYIIKISSKEERADLKNNVIEIRPGAHTTFRVLPEIVDISDELKNFDEKTRKCKLPGETEGFMFLRNYTKSGCEFETAANYALKVCKCLPWYYPNNFTGIPICEIFGATCFDEIMSNTSFYKQRPDQCLEDCKHVLHVPLPSYTPLKSDVICTTMIGFYEEHLKSFKHLYETFETFFVYPNNYKLEFPTGTSLESDCKEYMDKYVAMVTIYSPRSVVTLSKRVESIRFNDQISAIGGALGLFTGISILSMVEVLCCIIKIFVNSAKRCTQKEL